MAQNHAEAIRWYRLAADQGNASAQYYLGVKYHDGEGVAQDYAEALKWMRKAADQGYADAQTGVGTLFYQGQGVPQDYAEAIREFAPKRCAGKRSSKR